MAHVFDFLNVDAALGLPLSLLEVFIMIPSNILTPNSALIHKLSHIHLLDLSYSTHLKCIQVIERK